MVSRRKTSADRYTRYQLFSDSFRQYQTLTGATYLTSYCYDLPYRSLLPSQSSQRFRRVLSIARAGYEGYLQSTTVLSSTHTPMTYLPYLTEHLIRAESQISFEQVQCPRTQRCVQAPTCLGGDPERTLMQRRASPLQALLTTCLLLSAWQVRMS